MNRLLRMSAAALSTLLLATGANAVVNTNNSCPAAQPDCTTADCSVVSSDCTNVNGIDLQSLVDQCNSNTDALKALIENGSCSSDDLKCLISDGTCTVDEVCNALEDCDTGCEDIQSILDDVSCISNGDCVSDTDNCNSDVDAIKSILENIAAKSGDTDCTGYDKEVKGVTDCGDTKTVVKVIKSDCITSDTTSKTEDKNAESTANDKNCTSDCDTSCDESKACENGDCDSDVLKEELSKYGIDINDCIVNGNCGNGSYTITYENYDDIESILKSFGIDNWNIQKPDAESKPTDSKTDTENKPSDNKTNTESKPSTDTTSSETVSDNSTSSVSEYEKRVVELVNVERAKYGLQALKLNTELSAVARLKSQDMRDKNYFSHTSPTYGSPFDMMKQFGISYRTAGENIARGQRTPEEVVNGWMNSEGHRANILNSSFTEIGVGYVSDGNYWTQMFIG